jgi:hypothetical protein
VDRRENSLNVDFFSIVIEESREAQQHYLRRGIHGGGKKPWDSVSPPSNIFYKTS